MKTLLVLAKEPGLAAAIRAVVPAGACRVVSQPDVWEAEPLLGQDTIDACVLDAELTNIQPIRAIQEVRRRLPRCPMIVFTASKQWEWEEEAYLAGVAHVLDKPVRGRLFNTILERLWQMPSETPPPVVGRIATSAKGIERIPQARGTLESMRQVSGLLSYSLQAGALLNQFLLLLREILNVNRAVIFLRQPSSQPDSPGKFTDPHVFRVGCATGISPDVLEQLDLTLRSGIGAAMHRHGRILTRSSEDTQADREIAREFDLLGVQFAVPILDRETLMGIAVFDRRLTDEAFSSEELALVFRLLEELGLVLKNSRLHDQLAASHQMMADILGQLDSACVVIAGDFTVLHANTTARKLFTKPGTRPGELEFSYLPQAIGSKVFQVLKSGAGVPPFKFRLPQDDASIYQVTVTPFHGHGTAAANAALLLMEDFTQHERSYKLEIEAANLRLVNSMAERLAHEIGNSIVPLSTHQQLLPLKYDDPEFRASLTTALADSVKRISRLAKQMLFLARDTIDPNESMPLKQLIEEAFHEAQNFHSGKVARLHFDNGAQPVNLTADHAGLRHALSEVMLNALQASQADSQVTINARRKQDAAGKPWVDIEVTDHGPGFSPEGANRALNPFYTTRNVGIGLGLTVARKIIEQHRGKIEIAPAGKDRPSLVLITLPSE